MAGNCLLQPPCPWRPGDWCGSRCSCWGFSEPSQAQAWGCCCRRLSSHGVGRTGEQMGDALSFTQLDCTLCTPRLGPPLSGQPPYLPPPPQEGRRQLIRRKRPGFTPCQPLTCSVAAASQLFPEPCFLNLKNGVTAFAWTPIGNRLQRGGGPGGHVAAMTEVQQVSVLRTGAHTQVARPSHSLLRTPTLGLVPICPLPSPAPPPPQVSITSH